MLPFASDTMQVVLGKRTYEMREGAWHEQQSMTEGFRPGARQAWILVSAREDAMLDEIVRLRGLVRRAAAKTLKREIR